MKKDLLFIVSALVLVVFIFGAYKLYDSLGEKYAPDTTVTENDEIPDNTEEEISTVPDFTVIDHDGNEVSLSDMRGRPVIINFWASWCPPCKSEMPDFEEAYKKYGDRVVFMMLNMTDGSRETTETAKAFIDKMGYTFPVYFDTTAQAAMAYGAYSIPMSFFVDSEGYLAAYAEGPVDSAGLEKGIGMILEKNDNSEE